MTLPKPAKSKVSDVAKSVPPSLGGAPIYCAHTTIMPLSELVSLKNPRNPNKHPKKQLEILAKILKHGWRYAIVISSRSGLVIKGHGRIDAAVLAGLTHAPVDIQDYASEEEELQDMVADNAIAELSERDNPTVSDIIAQLDDGAHDLSLTGYTIDRVERFMTAAPPDLSDLVKKQSGKVRCPKCKTLFKIDDAKPKKKAASKKGKAK